MTTTTTENDDNKNELFKSAVSFFLSSVVFATVTTTTSFSRPAEAVTENQLLFLEAWRAVDKAYVDKTFNGVSWFKYREDTVKRTPMDSTEETYDAIRTMLAKLDDPFTRFLEPEKYALLTESTMSANITGVGVEMAYGESDAEIVLVDFRPKWPIAGKRPKTAENGRLGYRSA